MCLSRYWAVKCYDKYLGRPVIVGKSNTKKILLLGRRLKVGRGRPCQGRGREVLVIGAVQAIPVYIMSCFALHDGLCDQIEGLVPKSVVVLVFDFL